MNCYLSFKQTLLILFFKLPTPISRLLSRRVRVVTQSQREHPCFNKGMYGEGLMDRQILDHSRAEVAFPSQAH